MVSVMTAKMKLQSPEKINDYQNAHTEPIDKQPSGGSRISERGFKNKFHKLK